MIVFRGLKTKNVVVYVLCMLVLLIGFLCCVCMMYIYGVCGFVAFL